MKRINLTLDDESAKVLEGIANKSQFMRDAILIHNSNVLPQNLKGMQAAFLRLENRLLEFEGRFIELYEMVEKTNSLLEDIANRST